MGDYVDRGYYSVETVTLVMCLKVRYRDKVPSRETMSPADYAGVWILRRMPPKVRPQTSNTLQICSLPSLTCLIENEYFAHVGALPSGYSRCIRVLDRLQEVPQGPICDLLWSDPDVAVDGGLAHGAQVTLLDKISPSSLIIQMG